MLVQQVFVQSEETVDLGLVGDEAFPVGGLAGQRSSLGKGGLDKSAEVLVHCCKVFTKPLEQLIRLLHCSFHHLQTEGSKAAQQRSPEFVFPPCAQHGKALSIASVRTEGLRWTIWRS